jgi:hypothetical protein
MKRVQPWQILIVIFAIFWVIFAVVLIATNFPFYIISIALTTVAALSALVVALAWAYTHGY